MKLIKLLMCFVFVTSINAIADMDGSYYYSLKKYPEITSLLNQDNMEGDRSTVNVHMKNDGIESFRKDNESEVILVNYITFNNAFTDYYTAFIEINNNIYSLSEIDIPDPMNLKHKNNTYSLHKRVIKLDEGNLHAIYNFACKEPSSFIESGDCSNNEVYKATIIYKLSESGLKLINTNVLKI